MAVLLKKSASLEQQADELYSRIRHTKSKMYDHGWRMSWLITLSGLLTGYLATWLYGEFNYYISLGAMLFGGLVGYSQATLRHVREMDALAGKLGIIEAGIIGEELVTKELTKLPADYFVINDIKVPVGNLTTQIDHVVVCPNGTIICIETKHWNGTFYPLAYGWRRTQTLTWWDIIRGVRYFPYRQWDDPRDQSEYHARHVTNLIARAGYRFDVRPIVVLTHKRSRYKGLKEYEYCPVMYPRDIRKYILKCGEKRDIEFPLAESIARLILDSDLGPDFLLEAAIALDKD